MDETNTEQDQKQRRKNARLVIFGAYWVRGAVYIVVLLLLWYVFQPVIGYIAKLHGRYEIAAAAILFVILGPPIMGWIGMRLVNPIIRRWQRIKGVNSWEDRIVDELTPGEQRGFPIVLVPWPNQNMRTMAVLANTYKAADGETTLATVYMPRAPDPTSGGDLRVISLDQLEFTDWTMANLFRSCMTYGATGPTMFKATLDDEGTRSE